MTGYPHVPITLLKVLVFFPHHNNFQLKCIVGIEVINIAEVICSYSAVFSEKNYSFHWGLSL